MVELPAAHGGMQLCMQLDIYMHVNVGMHLCMQVHVMQKSALLHIWRYAERGTVLK